MPPRLLSVKSSFLWTLIVASLSAFAVFSLGPAPTTIWGHDTAIHMDASWRIFQGQTPHQDFSLHSQDLFYGLIALIMGWIGPKIEALVYLQAILVFVFPLIAWGVAIRRLPPAETLTVTIAIAVLLLGIQHLGDRFELITYACYYNKVSWAILLIVFLSVFFQPNKKGLFPVIFFEGLLLGLLIGSLVGLKASYFLVGVFCVLWKRKGIAPGTQLVLWLTLTLSCLAYCAVRARVTEIG